MKFLPELVSGRGTAARSAGVEGRRGKATPSAVAKATPAGTLA